MRKIARLFQSGIIPRARIVLRHDLMILELQLSPAAIVIMSTTTHQEALQSK